MAEAERMIVVCDKCDARLKLKPIQLKILKEVKCGKCGNRIPTASAVSANAAPPPAGPAPDTDADDAEQEAPASSPSPLKSETINPSQGAGQLEPPPFAVPAIPAVSSRLPTPVPPWERTETPKGRTASFGTSPGRPGDDSPAGLKAQIAEREAEINVFRQQILRLEAQIARQQSEIENLDEPEMLQRLADDAAQITELKETIKQKDKAYQELEAKLERAEQDRDEALAIRDSVLNNIKDLLSAYHSTEYEAARKRLQDLDDRIDRFVALVRRRDVPAAPPPPEPIPEAREHLAEH